MQDLAVLKLYGGGVLFLFTTDTSYRGARTPKKLEHSYIFHLKGDIKTYISSTEQSLSNIRGLRNSSILKVNFTMSHLVLKCTPHQCP